MVDMQLYDFTIELVAAAGALLLEKKQQYFSVGTKYDNPRDTITSLDLEIGNFITKQIQSEYPEHGIYNEEAATIEGNEYLWVLDPIDGTASFARGIPQYAISIGLLKNGVPELGVIFDPSAEEVFSFERGRGAFLNGEPVRVSDRTELKRTFVLFAAGRKSEQFEWAGKSLTKLLANVNKVKNFGSASLGLCYLAAGRLEAVVAGTFTPLDCVAAFGLLEAAGGVAQTASGDPLPLVDTPQLVYAANSDTVAEQLRLLLQTES